MQPKVEVPMRLQTIARLAVGIAILVSSIAAQEGPGQQPPTPAPPGDPSPGGVTPGIGRPPGPGTQPGQRPGDRPFPDDPNRQQIPEMQRPIYMSGKVMLDDGT
ncbi:MAG: hypothetical protein ACRD96_02875, partial [Bryobacteraceae bacterium]